MAFLYAKKNIRGGNMYTRTVQYYETDRMGITHHSNHVRWMEESRMDFLKKIGWGYDKLEEMGLISPVVSVECRYLNPSTFADTINIEVSVEEFKGIKLKLSYVMTNQNGETVCKASSTHCFVDPDGKPIRVNKEYPEFYEALLKETK